MGFDKAAVRLMFEACDGVCRREAKIDPRRKLGNLDGLRSFENQLSDDLLNPGGAGLAVGGDDDIAFAKLEVIPYRRVHVMVVDFAALYWPRGSRWHFHARPRRAIDSKVMFGHLAQVVAECMGRLWTSLSGRTSSLGQSETPRSVQTGESPLLRRCPRAVKTGYGAALQHEHFAQNPIRPAETVLAGVFAAATGERGIDHVVFLHQLAST